MKGILSGVSNITINASASEKAPSSIIIPVKVGDGVTQIKKFYFGVWNKSNFF